MYIASHRIIKSHLQVYCQGAVVEQLDVDSFGLRGYCAGSLHRGVQGVCERRAHSLVGQKRRLIVPEAPAPAPSTPP